MKKEKFKPLERRVKVFKRLIKEEELEIKRLKNKSREVRLNNPHNKRKNWYTDRLQELQLVIDFMSGKISEDEYTHFCLDDEVGKSLTYMGNRWANNN